MDRKKRIGTLIVMLAITLACAPMLPSVAPLPTQVVGAVDTMIAGTYAAAARETAINATSTPTLPATARSTYTATITVSPTATFILKTPTMVFYGGGGGGGGGSITITGTPGGPHLTYACKIVKLTPAFGSRLRRGENFRNTWTVMNTGNVVWDHNSVDYKYWIGKPIHKQNLYDLPNNVAPKKQVALAVAMIAPKTPGTYVTTWIMIIGKESFCAMEQKIIVK